MQTHEDRCALDLGGTAADMKCHHYARLYDGGIGGCADWNTCAYVSQVKSQCYTNTLTIPDTFPSDHHKICQWFQLHHLFWFWLVYHVLLINIDDKYWRNSKHFYEYLCIYVWANLMGMHVNIMQWKEWDKDQCKDILVRKIINFDKNQRQIDN